MFRPPPRSTRTGTRFPSTPLFRSGAQHLAVGGGVIVAAEQRPSQVGPGQLEAMDLLVEQVEAARRYGLPVGDRGRVEDADDLVEGQAGVLQHPYEDQPAQRRLCVEIGRASCRERVCQYV